MEEKQMNKYGIVLDGKMDEPIWDTVQEQTGFRTMGSAGGTLVERQTFFKVLPCEDRVYIGIKCCEGDMMQKVYAQRDAGDIFTTSGVELYLSPSGSDYECYQFLLTPNLRTFTQYYSEGCNITPDHYLPEWDKAVYFGEDYWSLEIEIPLTAFYWTPNTRWSDRWLVNVCRNLLEDSGWAQFTTWSPLKFGYKEPQNFRTITGMPVRPVRNDVCIVSAIVDLQEKKENTYYGEMRVNVTGIEDGEFTFTSGNAETKAVTLKSGNNEFTVPCFFEKEGRAQVELCLTRKDDGQVFKRYYPVTVIYEPIKILFTLPEYRNNFYPGQDYSKVAGTVKSVKAVTLKLEGPGIETQVLTPAADGSFTFATPNFQEGDAFLTVTTAEDKIVKKIRRLPPTGKRMAWISGGNLIVDGKPVLRREVYATYYMGGTAFRKKYDADYLHTTHVGGFGDIQPDFALKRAGLSVEETKQDGMPGEFIRNMIDETIERSKDYDFACYYISDEPDCRALSPVYLKNLYNYIAEKDPYHVILMASRGCSVYIDSADWFETHPYICPFNNEDGTRTYLRPFHTVGKYIDDVANLNRSDKCIGFLPTCYISKGGSSGWDAPTLDEYICHTWAAMVHGGKTLWPYAYHDLNDRASLYEGTRYVFSSFEALEDIVLMGKRTVLARSTEVEAVLYEHGEEKMFVLVNLLPKEQTVTLDTITGTWHEFRHDRMIAGNTFTLKPFETVIGTNVVKDAGMPTYQETAALIDKQEYERTHRGSLLFGHADDIEVKTSGLRHFLKVKLFDGVEDNLAVEAMGAGERFVELDLTKVKPNFDKLVLCGYNIENVRVLVGSDGAMQDLPVTETASEEYAKTFLLPEKICPDTLRFEITDKGVEFYEIELF